MKNNIQTPDAITAEGWRLQTETAALEYAARGFAVIPLHSPHGGKCSCGKAACKATGKHPRTKNGLKDATTDPAIIAGWWRQWPAANIGILTGEASGILVVDVDLPHGPDALDDLLADNGDFQPTLESETGGGGKHIYFEMPDGEVKNSAGKLGRGLDIRADGGYIIAPPSLHASGDRYEWTVDLPLAPAPDWLVSRLQKQKAKPKASPITVIEGGRNSHLTSLAGKLRRSGLEFDGIEAALRVENGKRCNPPLADDEIESIARSVATNYEAGLDGVGEDALALEFARTHFETWRYVATWKKWLHYNGLMWAIEPTLRIYDEVRDTVRSVVNRMDKSEAARYSRSQTPSGIEFLCRSDRRHAMRDDDFDSDDWSLNTPAGIVDLQSGEIQPHDPLAYCTKITAAAPGDPCPVWLQFINEVTGGDADLGAFLQRIAGYCLTGTTREHALFFLYGTGANGKSVFTGTLADVMADYATTAPMSTFIASRNEQHPTDMAGLRGARMVISTETQAGRAWDESKLKALTGGDKISARFMRQDFFTFLPKFKLLIGGNHKPQIRNVDEAMRRRLHLIPFTVTIPPEKRDPDLASKFNQSGVMAWALDGLRDYLREGLNPPASVVEATDEYLSSEDIMESWIAECCTINKNAISSTGELWTSWKTWCEAANEFAGTKKAFSQKLLDQRGIITARTTTGARGFRGIQIA
ncbi:MAG: hypothetical protein HOI45_11670 [Rhodospirillaceae bacterium]|jgi:P4 family phage/plasmid primase-like protien|nr:hypothetical protein [Rhodospirillaceae bacterium]